MRPGAVSVDFGITRIASAILEELPTLARGVRRGPTRDEPGQDSKGDHDVSNIPRLSTEPRFFEETCRTFVGRLWVR